ncbi:MAG TPA: hypothetical protein VF712_17150 [Thermoleophilaceae bacterium]|jgi:hypothetical protein
MGWVKRIVVGASAVATVMLLVSHFTRDDGSVGDLAVGFALVFAVILLGGSLLALVVHSVPRRWRALVLASTLLPALAAGGALGLPESAIHLSDDAEWAYRAGREISVAALVVAAALSAVVARGHGHRVAAIAGTAVLTFAIGAVARDLLARDQQPSWCYADEVEVFPDGGVATSGEYDDCTVLLPARKT